MSDPPTLTLASGPLRAEIAPALGGSVLQLDRLDGGAPMPILHPFEPAPERPTERALFVMLPWCNRVSGDGLIFEGRVHPLPRLVPGQPLPLHGTALHRAWTVASRTGDELRLTLRETGPAPFDFAADLVYRLSADALEVRIAVRHLGGEAAPYGVGFHPWLARRRGDRLAFRATGFVEEDDARLPVRVVPLGDDPSRDFRGGRTLPETLLNNTFLGWNGAATLERDDGLAVSLTADGATAGQLHVFSRAGGCGFVCLEPVSHTVDSTRRPMASSATMTRLAEGEEIHAGMRLSVLAR